MMESARKPRLSDLRLKRLAYFDQRYPPNPPAEPKLDSVVGFASYKTSKGLVERDGKKTLQHRGTIHKAAGPIPKTYKKDQRDIDPVDVGWDNGFDACNGNIVESNGFSLIGNKKRSTNQRLSAQEFDIHVSNDVDELFQSNRTKSRTPGWAQKEKCGKVRPTAPLPSNVLDAASMDYERKLISHLQRPDRQSVIDRIKSAQIPSNDGRGDSLEWSRDHLDSRKKHLKRFLYRQDEDTTPAVKAASEHNALYAQNILHQMGHVRKLRAEVHGELMSGFSEQEFKLKPVKVESEWKELSSEKETVSLLASRSSLQNGSTPMDSLGNSKLQQPSSVHVDIDSAQERPPDVTKSLSPPATEHSTVHLEQSDSDNSNEASFDLGALQEAAKQGDDILRKYIQSLSKNLKKKKMSESVGASSQNGITTDVNRKKQHEGEVQHFEKELPSPHLRHPKKVLYTNVQDEQDSSIAQALESEANPKTEHCQERKYRPKVSQPNVTSTELESLGLFNDLLHKRHNSPEPEARNLHSLPDHGLGQPRNLDRKADENSAEEEDLGLSTHRPQPRPISPLKQVYNCSEERHIQNLNKQALSDDCSGGDNTDLVQRHQYHSVNSQGESSELGLHAPRSDVEEKWLDHKPHNVIDTHNGPASKNADFLLTVASSKVRSALENHIGNTEQSGEEEMRRPPPSYEKLFSNSKDLSSDSVSVPHPSGTEIGSFVCSEQSTDSDQDGRARKKLTTSSHQMMPSLPPEGKKSGTSLKRHKPTAQVTTKNKSPRRPKTPERHVDGVREHHERERECRRQLSSRESQQKSQEKEDADTNRGPSTSPKKFLIKKETAVNQSAPLEKENRLCSDDDLKVDSIFWTFKQRDVGLASEDELLEDPPKDVHGNPVSPSETAKMSPDSRNLKVDNHPECEANGSDTTDKPSNHSASDVPPFDTHFKDLCAGGDATSRTHLTTGSAWDIEVSAQVQDGSVIRKGEDNESTVMGKIANFVPKLSNSGGGDFGGFEASSGAPRVGEIGAGEASHLFGNLPGRVDAWLTANETGRFSNVTDKLKLPGLANQDNPVPDRPWQSSEEDEAEHRVTFDLSPQEHHSTHHLHQNGYMYVVSSEERLPKQMKPRPSSAGPQRSRQDATRSKPATSKSKTSQLIDQPMYNRRWATSSSTWGTRRSAGDGLHGQRSSLMDTTLTSGSPAVQRKRTSSAKHQVALNKSDAEPRVRSQRARPQSANWKARESKQRSSHLKDEFLTANSAQVEEGLASRALNASHSVLPLTLQLICDSPRAGEGLSIWELLPDEILLHIFCYLSYKDLVQCAASCSRFHRIAMDDTLWRTIKLHKRRLSDFSLTQIGERHPVNLSLTQCHGNIVTENGLRNLFRSCSDTLQELNVSGCTGGELTGDSLLLHASRCQNLKSLDASWCQATDNGLSAISDSCQRLTSLCLNGCQSVSDECLNRVIKKHGKSLRVLEVLGCLQLSPETLQIIGTECRHLHTLNIGQCYKVTDDCMSQLVGHLRSLKHLDLRGCKQIRDGCVRKIVRNCKRLETLVLANCTHITNAALVEIATYLPTIRALDVSGCKKVSNEGVRSLATCCHYLTSLDVSSTGVNNKSVSALANYCNKTLVSVRFNCCKDITETAIVKLLKNCRRLKTLHLYGVKGLRNLGVLKLQYPCLQFE